MALKSIEINNLLSFEHVVIHDFLDFNCIVGPNNVGKSNLLNLLSYFFDKLQNKPALPPKLNSEYSQKGSITITFDTSKIRQVVSYKKGNTPYQKHVFNVLFGHEKGAIFRFKSPPEINKKNSHHVLTLTINKDDSIYWSDKREEYREVLGRLFPFFAVDTRRMDLYNWEKLWSVVSKLKFLNTDNLDQNQLIDYINSSVSKKSNSYKDFVSTIENVVSTSEYSYEDKILNYLKIGLKGHSFHIEGFSLDSQSDGTNTHRYLELVLNLLIALTRREFVTPIVFIDEPEIGLHPKKSEELIYNLFVLYRSLKKQTNEWEKGRYQTPYPNIIFSSHSANILKSVIKLFSEEGEHQVLHFAKPKNSSTSVRVMKSHYDDPRFLNVFSDNEARLFFSHFILFVEGATELEVFSNLKLAEKFPKLRKVDIYPTNDLVLKTIAPSNVNLTIPYLVLFDADLLLDVNISSGRLKFKKKKIDIKDLAKKYRYSYFNSKEGKVYRSFKNAFSHDESIKQLKPSLLQFDVFNYQSFINYLNRSCLYNSNHMITSSTIEGSLINRGSFDLFVRWLINTYLYPKNISQKSSFCTMIQSIKTRYQAGNMSIRSAFCALVKVSLGNRELSEGDLKFIKKIKLKFIAQTKKEVEQYNFTNVELVNIFRIVFEGKSDTLVSMESKNYSTFPQNVKKLITELKEEHLKNFPYAISKTSGWVTSFLNYSIDQMERKCIQSEEPSFDKEFQKTFPELHDIIRFASISIE